VPIIAASAAASHQLHGAEFTPLASPSLGSAETSVWRLSLTPDVPPAEHSVTREEIFVILRGHGTAILDGQAHSLAAGDTLVLPPRVRFTLQARGPEPLEAIVCLPVGGQAMMSAGGDPFTPPWAR
jgi:mannose-6-phosphate isomerase-like protein (cupin superfamily)